LRAIERMRLPMELRTRRYEAAIPRPRIDLRRTLRASLRTGGEIIDMPKWRGRIEKSIRRSWRSLDISGSMSQYTRLFLHFLHVLTETRRRVSYVPVRHAADQRHPAMRHRDPDEAMASCSASVEDWSGGTRIGETLQGIQPAVVAAGAEPGRHRAADHRRAGTGRFASCWPSRWTGCIAPAGG
jgi:uncharacterized protein with von Willebrand factor type A (vWA) domain